MRSRSCVDLASWKNHRKSTRRKGLLDWAFQRTSSGTMNHGWNRDDYEYEGADDSKIKSQIAALRKEYPCGYHEPNCEAGQHLIDDWVKLIRHRNLIDLFLSNHRQKLHITRNNLTLCSV